MSLTLGGPAPVAQAATPTPTTGSVSLAMARQAAATPAGTVADQATLSQRATLVPVAYGPAPSMAVHKATETDNQRKPNTPQTHARLPGKGRKLDIEV